MSLNAFFTPRAVAVVGSVSPGKIGYELLRQLQQGGFPNIVAVNPKGQGIFGLPAYSSIQAIPFPIDLVIIAAPAPAVCEILEDCGKSDVHAVVIISSGFGEVGNHAGESAIMDVAHRHSIRVVGPNCAGLVNTRAALFATLETRPPAGHMAFISQSGALGGAVLSWAQEQAVGISKFVSYGNRADLDEIDLLPFLAEDDETRVAALYIESVSDGPAFMRALQAFTTKKPLVVLKSGRTRSGQRAALSHTGSMAGSDAVFDAVFRETGAIRVQSIEAMFDICKGFVHLPLPQGRRLAIVTNSGGPGILTADQAEIDQLSVAETPTDLRPKLQPVLPSNAALANPVDLTVQGDGEHYRLTLEGMLNQGGYDCAIAINVATPYLDSVALAKGIVTAAQSTGKPIAACFMAGEGVAESVHFLQEHGIPNFATGERAASVLAALAAYAQRHETANPPATPLSPVTTDPLAQYPELLEPLIMQWMQRRGLPVPPLRFVNRRADVPEAAQALGFPLVAKVVSPHILHKSDAGGVALNLANPEAVLAAFDRLEAAAAGLDFRGIVLYPQVSQAQEVILGLVRDPSFGPILLLGMGGIYTEILHDVCLHTAPINLSQAQQMLQSLRSYPLLKGVRGQKGGDLHALAALMVRFSQLPFEYPEIDEMDLNPVFVKSDRVVIGDVRILTRSKA